MGVATIANKNDAIRDVRGPCQTIRDLAIFVVTTTQTDRRLFYPCACARDIELNQDDLPLQLLSHV